MNTHNIHFHEKILKYPLIFVFLNCRRNVIGAQKRVGISHGKRAISVRVIEVYCNQGKYVHGNIDEGLLERHEARPSRGTNRRRRIKGQTVIKCNGTAKSGIQIKEKCNRRNALEWSVEISTDNPLYTDTQYKQQNSL